MTLNHTRAVLLMVLVTFMWSTAGVVTRHLEFARSFEVTFWRAFFTAVTLLVLLPLLRGGQVWRTFRNTGWVLWVSGLCWSIMFTAFMLALTMTSVANVLVTMSVGPLLTALVARLFIGHRIPVRTWVAIVLAGLGIGWMYVSQLGDARIAGTLIALCVPVAAATNWTVTQRAHTLGKDVDLVPAVLIGAVLSCIFTLPLSLPFQASYHDLGLLAFLGAFQLAIPCTFSVMCAKVLKAPEVALLGLLEVVFGILLAWWGASESPTTATLVGGTLVIVALAGNEWLGWKTRGGAVN